MKERDNIDKIQLYPKWKEKTKLEKSVVTSTESKALPPSKQKQIFIFDTSSRSASVIPQFPLPTVNLDRTDKTQVKKEVKTIS